MESGPALLQTSFSDAGQLEADGLLFDRSLHHMIDRQASPWAAGGKRHARRNQSQPQMLETGVEALAGAPEPEGDKPRVR